MKKFRKVISAVLVLAMCLALCACGQKPTYIVHFSGNGGRLTEGDRVQVVEEGGSAEAPVFEKEGYEFAGWDTSFDSITEETYVNALWTRSFSVTFDAAGGSIVSGDAEQTLQEGETPEAPEAERSGYTFAGWSPAVGAVTEDTVYTAQWEGKVLTANQVYKRVSPSMVEITTYDAQGNAYSIGSGFFIDTEGTVVTNYHVIDESTSAEITLYAGGTGEVLSVLAYDSALDIAVLETDAENTTPVTFSTHEVSSGDTIYTLGSSLGETDTFTTGIVSNPSRVYDGEEYIQIDAAISHGNSGGPLINDYGEVIGINSWQYSDGQNMNYAIRITELDRLTYGNPVTLAELYELSGYSAASGQSPSGSGSSESTIVTVGDASDSVYDDADYIESEDNSSWRTADPLVNGAYFAGYVFEEDVDLYSFTLNGSGEIFALLMTYWSEDDDYIYVVLVDENYETVTDVYGNACYFNFDSDTAVWYLSTDLDAGTYYLAVLIGTDDYPYSTGCHYICGAEW